MYEKKELFVVSSELSNGHIGIRKVLLMFRENYIYKKNHKLVNKVNRTCYVC